jgi:Protein of unknown function (DUF1553)/Protein of unknown function (DUF1549)/Planctomycete cytochrome C
MKSLLKWSLLFVVLVLAAAALPWFGSERIDYNTEVKPILNKHCIACHGGVKRKADFSLLTRELALQPAESGKPPIVPGKPGESEFIRRLTAHDPEERMPYREEPLKKEEIDLLRQWVKEGAYWDRHWAYRAVEKPELPLPKGKLWGLLPAPKVDWIKKDLDWFIYDKLRTEQLQPAPEADKLTLLQRVGLDLTGLPASDALAQQFLNDPAPEAYERLVDSLLASKRYGERWTAMWLDLARYADTKGYERDDRRTIWHYRDWLIRAFNADMPYDQFLTEQLAGDLLPDPTDAQYVATAFHRNTMNNDEGGTDNEEFRTAAVLDRVNTTWEALMGTTFSCVQCHSHPYDPFMHEEYYKFVAFFNNTRDEDSFEEYPYLRHFSTGDSLKLLDFKVKLAETLPAEKVAEIAVFLKTLQPSFYSLQTDSFTNCELYDTKWLTMRNHATARLPRVNLDGKTQLIFRFSSFAPKGIWTVHTDRPDGPVLFKVPIENTKNARKTKSVDFQPITGTHDLWFRYENPALKTEGDAGLGFDWFYFTAPVLGANAPLDAGLQKEFRHLLDVPTATTPVMVEAPHDMARTTHVFERGNRLAKGEKVNPDVPRHLNPFPTDAPRNRLGVARWMTDPQHPLTARALVNRLWEQLFGVGLAETLEDLGTQGIPPTHRELLDHLSWQLVHEYDWSLKKLLREMVLSAVYRQDSRVTPVLLERDPDNKLYARGPRVRLSAEQLRDRTLAAAGTLSDKMYGPSVMPFQPADIWKSPYGDSRWALSTGEDRFRRAVYTYWKRSAPYPSMMTFDGASREVCTVRRVRTNTPLQALVTLNDSAYVEAARIFAHRIEKQGLERIQAKISKAYEWAVGRPLAPEKSVVLEELYQNALKDFTANPVAANHLLGLVETPPAVKTKKPQSGKNAEPPPPPAPGFQRPMTPEQCARAAALTVVTNAIFNLDEFVVKH